MILQSLFFSLFNYVNDLKINNFSTVSYNEFRQAVLLHIKEIKNRGGSLDENELNAALFAVCAWIDESVQESLWEGKSEWQHRLLQTELFNTANAGDEFFTYLSKITPNQKDLFRIFYRCMILGFKGECHELIKKSDLIKYKKYVLECITKDAHQVDNINKFIAFPEAYECKVTPDLETMIPSWKKRIWWLLPIPILVLIYLFFYLVINNTVNNYMQLLK
ncbi:TPA: DotU family type IV/VI secretion system protein [Legionella pneumophila]|nr:DotU family type IV/VI secretion system protein [Legionella pneumophila]HAT2137531.1 DotU family type IV/VI secretion system protein [Legionella pneumophila]HAT2143643.1 DotU family type IV/VI secretion system protein [Legionella pneumophila]HAT2146790.1 DotU family type IV/VI secretion system protein [Legionella pneumophila]HAT2161911.1 DotU family type IV/VI secretion system protein [Legionella pneumophila]